MGIKDIYLFKNSKQKIVNVRKSNIVQICFSSSQNCLFSSMASLLLKEAK